MRKRLDVIRSKQNHMLATFIQIFIQIQKPQESSAVHIQWLHQSIPKVQHHRRKAQSRVSEQRIQVKVPDFVYERLMVESRVRML